ncbi:transcriptional regulator [Shewanella maritima]|uniref:winged helix-turn-helix domain-containing protein n=1 Tax=Shewanella maritima TaxID=2520507 RepID=UPI0037364DF7
MIKVTPYLEFDHEAKVLTDKKHNLTVELTYSEAEVFACLVAAPDQVFTKEELLAAGWPDRVVAPTSLTQCVSTLRKKLEPYSEIQLKTLARRGYQLNISNTSHVTMLAVNDADSIKSALWNVSLMVKTLGLLLALAVLGYYWYVSDLHKVIRHTAQFDSNSNIDITVEGLTDSLTLIQHQSETSLQASMWQQHILPSGQALSNVTDFSGYAMADNQLYSMAVCINAENEDCKGKNLVNLAMIDNKRPAKLDMHEFDALRQVMENRIRYNRELIPAHGLPNSEIEEHHYHGDIYFPVADQLLVRADIGISLIYEKPVQGKFYFSACLTDQDCLTTPIKYKVRGEFEQYRQKIGDIQVEAFHVKLAQKNLIRPENVSDSAMYFYREIRKHNIQDDELFFYRLSKDDHSAVWVIPLIENIVLWTKYERVLL